MMSTTTRWMVGGLLSVLLFDTRPVPAWQTLIYGTPPDGYSQAISVALDSAGDIIATGGIDNPGTSWDSIAVKLSSSTGTEVWRQAIRVRSTAVAVDSIGDVVAAGVMGNTGTTDAAVVKLAGASGAEIWHQTVDGALHGYNSVNRIALDPGGDVLALASLSNTTLNGNFTVLRLAGTTGTELWRHEVDSATYGCRGFAMALDQAGDVLAAGSTGTGRNFTVVKLNGATGAEIWRQSITSYFGVAWSIAVDTYGDVFAAGALTTSQSRHLNNFVVNKLARADGTELWRRVISAGAPNDVAHSLMLRVDAADNAVVAGDTAAYRFTVMKLTGSSGTQIWRHQVSHASLANDLTLDPNGDVVVAGATHNRFSVQKFRGTTGVRRWYVQQRGFITNTGQANAVLTNPAGNVLVAGISQHAFTVVKACGRNGHVRATAQICPD